MQAVDQHKIEDLGFGLVWLCVLVVSLRGLRDVFLCDSDTSRLRTRLRPCCTSSANLAFFAAASSGKRI